MKPKTFIVGIASIVALAWTAHAACAAGKPRPPPPDTTQQTPPARQWHAFTGDGGLDSLTSKLYLFGGNDSNGATLSGDLWVYDALANTWKLIVPSSPAKPAYRQNAPLSCGNGQCVTSGSPPKVLKETWVYTAQTNVWWKMNCKKFYCPTSRTSPVMVFDPVNGYHLLFGGQDDESVVLRGDTLTFDTGTRLWTVRTPQRSPAPRWGSAAAHVPGVGIVLFGGGGASGSTSPLCDMFAWTGTDWVAVTFDLSQEHPCLRDHSMAWDSGTARLAVVSGYSDASSYGSPNATQWRFAFDAGGRSGTWSKAAGTTCVPIGGTDGVVHPGAKMALDVPTQTQVFFGGGQYIKDVGQITYGNTVECY